ncbi:MAG: hypothetical protein KDA45_12890, partial [Planctomycetales bacterium]|nr:hypothetical protein [Planctomycetales bacterium]
MDVLAVAAVGVAIVLVGILLLRLHPLLGLLLGSLFVFAATPREVQMATALAADAVEIRGLASGGLLATQVAAAAGDYRLLEDCLQQRTSTKLTLARATPTQMQRAAQRGELSPTNAVWFSVGPQAPPLTRGMRLVAEEDVQRFDQTRWTSLGGKLSAGFAKTFVKLGIPVTMAA